MWTKAIWAWLCNQSSVPSMLKASVLHHLWGYTFDTCTILYIWHVYMIPLSKNQVLNAHWIWYSFSFEFFWIFSAFWSLIVSLFWSTTTQFGSHVAELFICLSWHIYSITLVHSFPQKYPDFLFLSWFLELMHFCVNYWDCIILLYLIFFVYYFIITKSIYWYLNKTQKALCNNGFNQTIINLPRLRTYLNNAPSTDHSQWLDPTLQIWSSRI